MTPQQKAAALRDPVLFQKKILCRKLWAKQEEIIRSVAENPMTAVRGCHSSGKLANYSLVIETPTGLCRWGDIHVGDLVFAGDGSVTRVTGRFENGVQPIYRVTFDDHSSTTCGLDHLWNVKGPHTVNHGADKWLTLTTGEILARGIFRQNGKGRNGKPAAIRCWHIPRQGPAQFPAKDISLDPYWVGIWLGDGTRALPMFSKPYPEIKEKLCSFGMTVTSSADGTMHTVRGIAHQMSRGVFLLKSPLRFVPPEYLRNSVEVRRSLLCGLLDSDGECVPSGSISFSSTSRQLAEDVAWLVRSLGGRASIAPTAKKPFYRGKNGERLSGLHCHRVHITLDWNPFTVRHKSERWNVSSKRFHTRWIDSIEYSHDENSMCITVDHPSQLYLANDFIVTHNSFVSAGIVPWWLTRYKTGKVFTTAPTLRQVQAFWKDIAVARLGSPIAKQILPEPNMTGMNLAPDRYAIGASSSAGVNLQGFHGSDVLIICDEAPGIQSDIWDSIQGIRAGGKVRVLELGNPVVASGHFYDSFTRERAYYNCISISAFDTPNLQHADGRTITEQELLDMSTEELDYNPAGSLTTRSWVKERLQVWGPTHPKYLARVLGEFPRSDPNSVFDLAWIEKARRDPSATELREANRIGRVQVGIDVAGAGSDETVLTARVGGIIIEQHSWADPDPRGAVCAILARLARGQYQPTESNGDWIKKLTPRPLSVVVVDIIGIGYNFALHLADQGFPVWGFNAGARPVDVSQFVNQKAEAYWLFRGYLSSGEISNLADEEAAAQLSTIRYRENSRGLTEIESKDERNKRGIPGSPDRAESVIMAFLRVVAQKTEAVLNPGDYQISFV